MNLKALLALFGRSVRDDMRSKALIWARIGIAGSVLFAMFSARWSFPIGAPGLRFLTSMVWMNFVFICIAGLSYFASAITEEKEEGTLGILRMTDLSPVSILLGKGTSRLIGGLLLVLVQVPFVLLAITLGGVRIDQVVGCYALLAAFLFFFCNVGLLASVLSARAGAAAVMAGVIAAVWMLWPGTLAEFRTPLQTTFEELRLTFNTPGLLKEILGNRGESMPIGGAVLALLGGGAAAFVAAWLLFDRFCGERPIRSWAPIGKQTSKRALRAFLATRPGRAWDDAICWRDFHYLHGGIRLGVFKFLIYAAGAILLGFIMLDGPGGGIYAASYRHRSYMVALFGCSLCIVVFESLFATSRMFKVECRERTFSSLFILPQYYDALFRSKRRAVLLSLIPGMIFLFFSGIATLGAVLESTAVGFFVFFAQTIGFVVAQLFFNHYLVAWFSLRLKWGGLPLALAISWIGNVMAAFLAAVLFHIAALMILIVVTTFASFAMRNAFRIRLEVAASES